MSERVKLLFELLQVSIGCRSQLSAIPTNEEWFSLFDIAVKQSIAGIIFTGVERLPKEQWPEKQIVFQWMALTSQIEQRNVQTTEACQKLIKKFEADGFKTCILKGQANYAYYPKELKNRRTCGDIDVWIHGDGLRVKDVLAYSRRRNPKGEVLYHHMDYGVYNGIEVEVHYRPSFMFNPIYNHRLQKWFMHHGEKIMVELPDGVGCISVPSVEFNIIFQLSHIYNHVLHEGIGLRQFVDYYFVLRQIENPLRLPLYKGRNLKEMLRCFGLWKFAGAVMYVMREVFALDEQYMVAPVDEKRGKTLLNEILKGGNFGKYDEANIKANNRIKKNLQRIKRDIRMMRYFPSECLWEPAFRVYHFFWRLTHR